MTRRSSIAAIAVVSLLVALAGCAKETTKTASPSASTTTESATPKPEQPAVREQQPTATSPTPRPVAPASSSPSTTGATREPAIPLSVEDFSDEPALKDVFFEPGRADIGRNGMRIMRDNRRWLVEHRDRLVLIEGHTDYKGSREVNLAMAERRAHAAVSVLVKEGVADTRLWTVSYGSDRPVCEEKSDACAAKNRHVHFRVKRLER